DPRFSALGFQPGDTVYEPCGCDRCGGTGYRGRSGIFEIIEMSPDVRDLITEHTDSAVIQTAAAKAGMPTMIADAIAKCRSGLTSVAEVLRVTPLGRDVPDFQYRAITQSGELVSGSITAPTAAEVAKRIEFLGLVPIEAITETGAKRQARFKFSGFSSPRAEDVTVFTRDLALLLKAGARIDDALDLLAADIDIGRLRPVVGQIRGHVLAGESLSDALTKHPNLFPPMYVALVKVGE